MDAQHGSSGRPAQDEAAQDEAAAAPLAPDRPFVDGTAADPAQLRAEVEELADEHRERVDLDREELAATVAELATRMNVGARVRGARDRAVVTAKDRAADTARRPAVIAGAAAVVGLLVVLGLRRRG